MLEIICSPNLILTALIFHTQCFFEFFFLLGLEVDVVTICVCMIAKENKQISVLSNQYSKSQLKLTPLPSEQ